MIYSKFIATLFIVTSLTFTGLSPEAAGQTLPFRSYTIESGLSESVAYDLLQDSQGYLWIATGYGLNRFDGVEMSTFYERNGLNDNHINVLYEGPDGRLWVGTDSGVNVVEEDSVMTPTGLQDLERYTVLSILHDDQGDWWFGTDGAGVWLLDESSRLTQFSTVHGMGGNIVRRILQDDDGILWFATNQGLTNLDTGNFNTFTDDHGLPHDSINDILFGDNGSIWLATEGGISLREENSYTNYSTDDGLPSNSVLSLTFDTVGRLWYGTDGGAGVLDNGFFRNYTTADGLPADIVLSTMTDREGQLWFGTLGGGVTLFAGEHFANYTMDDGLASNVITSFARGRDGLFWIASYGGGLMSFDGESFTTYTEADGLADNNVHALYHDTGDRLWIGTAGGVSVLEDGRFIQTPAWMSGLHAVRGFLDDESEGNFWVATQDSGAYRYDGETLHRYHEENMLESNTVVSVVGDNSGGIWLATYGGVSVYRDGEFTTYTIEDGLPSNGVISIFIDPNDTPWISTFNGFARAGNESIEAFQSTLEFPGAISYFMFQDRDGYYWSGTNAGLVRFDYERYIMADSDLERDLSFRLVAREQGLIANEMNARAVFRDTTGRDTAWLGSAGGMSRFYPSMLPVNNIAPKIHMEEVMVAGEMVDPENSRVLSHDRNFVQFAFTGISFDAPSRILYEYRLRGVDSDWVRSYERTVRYPSLSPGDYTFQVRAYNSSGIRSDEVAAYSFIIRNPYWLQWWFLAVIALAVTGVIFFIYNYYRVRRLMEIEKMRVQIASDLHDDVGSSLTELALQTDFIRTGNLDESVENTLRQIGDHSRRIVSTLDDIVWYIDARNDTTGDLTDRMQDHANRVLAPGDIKINFDFSGVEMNAGLPVLIKENLYLIYKEAINNIAKHSDADIVEIALSMNQNRFKLRIKDNGKQQNESRRSGQGLRNMQLRARRIGTEAVIESNGGYAVTVEGSLK